jgi:hypothetical protein
MKNQWKLNQWLEPQEIIAALMDGCRLRGPEMVTAYIEYIPEDRNIELVIPAYSNVPERREDYLPDYFDLDGYRIIGLPIG